MFLLAWLWFDSTRPLNNLPLEGRRHFSPCLIKPFSHSQRNDPGVLRQVRCSPGHDDACKVHSSTSDKKVDENQLKATITLIISKDTVGQQTALEVSKTLPTHWPSSFLSYPGLHWVQPSNPGPLHFWHEGWQATNIITLNQHIEGGHISTSILLNDTLA